MLSNLLVSIFSLASLAASAAVPSGPSFLSKRAININSTSGVLQPKVVIVSTSVNETERWVSAFNLTSNITIPGLYPEYDKIHADDSLEVFQITTGPGEINAAASISALTLSSLFDLSQAYFLVGGVGVVNPYAASIGSVVYSKFAVQASVQYSINPLELKNNSNFSITGYYPYGAYSVSSYPTSFYGTEVFELNAALRDRALELAGNATLVDSASAYEARSAFPSSIPGGQGPVVVDGDVVTSDTRWYGRDIASAVANYTTLITNGQGQYAVSQAEANAVLESLVRASIFDLVDFSRVVVLKAGYSYDQTPLQVTSNKTCYNFTFANAPTYTAISSAANATATSNISNSTTTFVPGNNSYCVSVSNFTGSAETGLSVAYTNLVLAGETFILDVLSQWSANYSDNTFTNTTYVGDIYDSLGGEQNFGPSFVSSSVSVPSQTAPSVITPSVTTTGLPNTTTTSASMMTNSSTMFPNATTTMAPNVSSTLLPSNISSTANSSMATNATVLPTASNSSVSATATGNATSPTVLPTTGSGSETVTETVTGSATATVTESAAPSGTESSAPADTTSDTAAPAPATTSSAPADTTSDTAAPPPATTSSAPPADTTSDTAAPPPATTSAASSAPPA